MLAFASCTRGSAGYPNWVLACGRLGRGNYESRLAKVVRASTLAILAVLASSTPAIAAVPAAPRVGRIVLIQVPVAIPPQPDGQIPIEGNATAKCPFWDACAWGTVWGCAFVDWDSLYTANYECSLYLRSTGWQLSWPNPAGNFHGSLNITKYYYSHTPDEVCVTAWAAYNAYPAVSDYMDTCP